MNGQGAQLDTQTVQQQERPQSTTQLPASADNLLQGLQNDLDVAEKQLEAQADRSSEDGSADVQSWVQRVNRVQDDIERSKAAVRSIVQQAEKHKALDAAALDCSRKVELLEEELSFNEALETALAQIQSLHHALEKTRDLVLAGGAVEAAQSLHQVQQRLVLASTSVPPNVVHALDARAQDISSALQESAKESILAAFLVVSAPASVTVADQPGSTSGTSLADAAQILEDLGGLDDLVEALASRLDHAFVHAWSTASETPIVTLQTSSNKLWTEGESRIAPASVILGQISTFVEFLAAHMPARIAQPLLDAILPKCLEQFETNRLMPSIPLAVEDLPQLEGTIVAIQQLDTILNKQALGGRAQTTQWLQRMPTLWLARQREHTLTMARQCLLSNVSGREEVERVETQAVNGDGHVDEELGQEDAAWDTEWNDGAGPNNDTTVNEPDEDASAWETGEDESDQAAEPATTAAPDADEEADDAWGWGESGEGQATTSEKEPAVADLVSKTSEGAQVLTLRETYTITGVPKGLLELFTMVWRKAEALGDEGSASSTIAGGVAALWNVPALGMALYRAMALSAYDKVDLGRILLYNDLTWMAEQARGIANGSYTATQDIGFSRTALRKMEQEASAFDRSAKTAYGAEMDAQRTILRDLLDGAQGFSNCTTSPYAEECDNAVAMVVDRLRDVHRLWQPIMSKSALQQSIGSLLSTVISKFIMDIEDLSDIGEEESKRLLSYCKSISSISDLFLETNAATQEVRDMTALYCINWLKLQYLGEILDGNLADIKYLWQEGELSMEFDADEVTDLIRALFADSVHRRTAIASISRP